MSIGGRKFTVALLAFAACTSCFGQAGRNKALPGGKTVTQAASKSIVLQSTHILLIQLVTVDSGPWRDSTPGLQARTANLTIEVREVLRGRLDPAPAGPVPVTIIQSDYAGELMMQPLPGPWPGGDLKPGEALVVYARSKDTRVENLLVTPACTQVVPAEPVLTGLRIASQAESGNLPVASTLALAAAQIDRLDPTFAEFLWGKYGEAAMASQPEFDLLVSFAEKAGLSDITRQTLLKSPYDLVRFQGDATPERAQRLALAMCRVLSTDEAAGLHENLIANYLPNLLGITSRLPAQPASAVFKGHEEERNTLRGVLKRHGANAGGNQLQSWLDAS